MGKPTTPPPPVKKRTRKTVAASALLTGQVAPGPSENHTILYLRLVCKKNHNTTENKNFNLEERTEELDKQCGHHHRVLIPYPRIQRLCDAAVNKKPTHTPLAPNHHPHGGNQGARRSSASTRRLNASVASITPSILALVPQCEPMPKARDAKADF